MNKGIPRFLNGSILFSKLLGLFIQCKNIQKRLPSLVIFINNKDPSNVIQIKIKWYSSNLKVLIVDSGIRQASRFVLIATVCSYIFKRKEWNKTHSSKAEHMSTIKYGYQWRILEHNRKANLWSSRSFCSLNRQINECQYIIKKIIKHNPFSEIK